jgi:hypothetical protein
VISIAELCEQLQSAWVSRLISESTWGYPIVGALHVLAMALFAGTVLPLDLGYELRGLRRIGLAVVLGTGLLLFASGASGYYEKTFFKIKIGLLVLLILNALAGSRTGRTKVHVGIALVLWAAVIFASRGIAYF